MIANALATMLIATVGVAQTSAPSVRVPAWQQSEMIKGRPEVIALYRFAVCARARHRPAAEALLAAPLGSAEAKRLLMELVPAVVKNCAVWEGGFRTNDHQLVRGAIAEAIYNADRYRPRSAASLPLPEDDPLRAARSPRLLAWWVARCAVYRAPQAAHGVLQYAPGAKGEQRALIALEPAFLGCLPDGEKLDVAQLTMRAIIAEELYAAARAHRDTFDHV